jgi:hypothetical protein
MQAVTSLVAACICRNFCRLLLVYCESWCEDLGIQVGKNPNGKRSGKLASMGIVRNRIAILIGSILVVALGVAVSYAAAYRDGHSSSSAFGSGRGTVTISPSSAASSTAPVNETPTIASGWSLLSKFPGDSTIPGVIPSLAWSLADPNTLYLCRTALILPARPANPAVLLRSGDRGKTWQQLTPPEPTGSCQLQADPSTAGQLSLADDLGHVFVSRDAGSHWQAPPMPPHMSVQTGPFIFVHGRIFYGIYYTDDLQTWHQWYAVNGATTAPSYAVDPAQSNLIYMLRGGNCAGQTTPGDAVCMSQDSGRTWRSLLSLAVAPGPEPELCTVPGVSNMLYVWAPNGTTSGGARGLYVTTDAGAHVTLDTSYVPDPTSSGLPLPPPDAPCNAAGWQVSNMKFTDQGLILHLGSQPLNFTSGAVIPAGVSTFTSSVWNQVAPYPIGNSSHVALILFALPRASSQESDLLAMSPQWLLMASQPISS